MEQDKLIAEQRPQTLSDILKEAEGRRLQRERDLAELERMVVAGLVAFQSLPVIVDTPGDYRTRDGRRVTVYGFSLMATSSVCGHIWKEFRGKPSPRIAATWEPNGRRSFVGGERASDIVARWAES